MFIQKRVLQSVFAMSLLSIGAVASAATTTVQGGTVHFTGKIVNAACAVSADSANQTVDMGQYRTALFTEVGIRSNAVPFTIKLEDCDPEVSGKAQTSFTGNASSDDDELLAVSNIGGGAAGAASGVGIEISDSMGTVLKPDGTAFSVAQTLNDGLNTLHFTARYRSTSATVTPGAADADATFTMQYN